MWIEIFKIGRHRNLNGNEQNWTKDDLDHMVASYDPNEHEAPVVIGHPKDNAPAYGWVEALKREGGILLAKLKDLVPEFVDMLRRGLFKKRSVALYPDHTLKHVGFLGAMPPAVKGLRDIGFNNFEEEGEITMTIEFSEGKSAGERLHRKILEFLESSRGKNMTYGEAFNIVSAEDRELTREYLNEISMPAQLGKSAEERLMEKVHEFFASPRGEKEELSFAEVMNLVATENPELAQEYLSESRKKYNS